MWTTDQLGLATWRDGQSAWHFDVRGGEFGIGIVDSEAVEVESRSVDERYVSILPVDANPLPLASEQYVRRSRYFINYPQGDGNYAIRLALEPIESLPDSMVLEASISIQTDLLDSHPMLDLVAEGTKIDCFDQESEPLNGRSALASQRGGASSITVAHGQATSMAILLGPHDRPFTSDRSSQQLMCLRLFGDFLEKGVIRTARPWIVVDRRSRSEFPERLFQWHRQLCQSPTPLSS